MAQREAPALKGAGGAELGRPLLPERRLQRELALRARRLGREPAFSDTLGAEGLVMAGRSGEALELTDRLLATVVEGSPLSVVLHRVRGIALAQLGQLAAAEAALEASLQVARPGDGDFELAQTLDSLCRLHALVGASLTRSRERDAIVRRLNLVRLPRPPLPVAGSDLTTQHGSALQSQNLPSPGTAR